jgi:hypothetical protein
MFLVETFFTWPTSDSLQDEWMRRNEAVMAGIQYCGFPEGGPLRGWPKRPVSDKEESIAEPSSKKQKRPERPTLSAWEEKLGTVKKKGCSGQAICVFPVLKRILGHLWCEETLQVVTSAGSQVQLL